MNQKAPEIPEYVRGLQTAMKDDASRPRVILGSESISTLEDHDSEGIAPDLIAKIKRDVRQGKRTREIMEDRGLSWTQLRPIMESITAPSLKAARRKRIATLAMESAEALAERLTGETDNLKPKDIANTIAKLATTAAQLDGEPIAIVEHRHTIDLSSRATGIDELRKKMMPPTIEATVIPTDELIDIAAETEVGELCKGVE